MKLLIAGGSGFLGQHLVPLVLERHPTVYTYFANDTLGLSQGRQLDLRDAKAVLRLVEVVQPDVIVHLGGSNRSADMYNVIVQGAQNITAAAKAVDARLIHLSTDVLFDGTDAPYAESAEPTPIHAYGRAKAAAEAIVARYANQVTIRTSLIYSRWHHGCISWMEQALARGETIRLFSDHWRNPILADDLALACLELAQNEFTGVLNVAGRQAMRRSEFSYKLLAHFAVPLTHVTAAPDTTGKFPKDVRLDTTLAQTLLDTPLRGVAEVLG